MVIVKLILLLPDLFTSELLCIAVYSKPMYLTEMPYCFCISRNEKYKTAFYVQGTSISNVMCSPLPYMNIDQRDILIKIQKPGTIPWYEQESYIKH